MVPKFLIDECLSPDLAALARDRGFAESSHVTWLGKAGWKDWELKRFIWSRTGRSSLGTVAISEGPLLSPALKDSMRMFPFMPD